MDKGTPIQLATLETCETLLAPGRKWHISPYLSAAFHAVGDAGLAARVPVYQSVVLDLLKGHQLPRELTVLDWGSPQGVGAVAILDLLLAWETACALFGMPDDIDLVHISCRSNDGHSCSFRLHTAFENAVRSRAETHHDFAGLAAVAEWTANLVGSSHDVQETPNLVLIPFPWLVGQQLDALLNALPTGAIVAGLAWKEPDVPPNMLFAWRYKLLKDRNDFVALGPCGQEYGRQLPDACRTCIHGRHEPVHIPGAENVPSPVWSYTSVIKQADATEIVPYSLVSTGDLQKVIVDEVHLRYVGTFRERVQPSDHPDTFNDNPADTQWKEYLKVCPGHTDTSRLALERRAGMQTPHLHYGQWLHLNDLQPQRPYSSRPDVCTLRIRNEAVLHAAVGSPNPKAFLPAYSAGVRAAVDEAAHRLFGFDTLWPFQHRILERVLCGGDIFAIAATGGGKSECYILPALLLPGITVVVSPLKSLMQDQYEQRIRDRYGMDYLTTYINGDVPFYERQGRLRRLILGHFKLIYLTPEQLERGYILEALRQAEKTVGFRRLALDEAHCISQWGHDFRPSYLNIIQRLQDYGLHPQCIALTATASPLVRDDVCKELRLDPRNIDDGGDVFIDAANRPELNLVVRRVKTTEEKARIIVDALRQLNGDGSAIVFMPHTGGTLEQPKQMGAPQTSPRASDVGMVSTGVTPFVHYLSTQLGEDVAMYHGKMNNAITSTDNSAKASEETDGTITRQEEQRSFMSGRKRVMVATKGFGMGVDKPDIRLVIHRSPPANLEAYAQESGRAGRDGKLATVLLLYSEDHPRIVSVSNNVFIGNSKLQSDREIQQYFMDKRYVRRQDMEAMIAFLRSKWVQHINEGLYFTCDKVMEVFNYCEQNPSLLNLARPYKWPNFSPRVVYSYESSDHKQIRDRGYLYEQKCKYIGRILAVLFNNRPTVNNQVMPLIKGLHKTGTLLRVFRMYSPERIVESPAYFGEQLRAQGVDIPELRALLPNGDRTDLMPLAVRLNLTFRETASMLYDIRSCEGRTGKRGHWVGTLLNFWYIEAPRWVKLPNPYDTAAWRSYAGAYRRAQPKTSRNLDDYFPEWTLCKPDGWEVIPDIGLSYPDSATYLDRFVALHNARRENDKDNFAYLINRYIGGEEGPQECLRSLLMGYLKTNEVVVGGNCHGCSVCVPDLRFDRHTVEQRKAVVVRLLPETIDLISQIESANRRAPSVEALEHLLNSVAQEDALGRSGSAYLDSWLVRLLQDDPQHRGALWTRLWAFEHQTLKATEQAIVSLIERLTRLSDSRPEWLRLRILVDRYRSDFQYQRYHLSLTACAAELAELVEETTSAIELWSDVMALTDDVTEGSSEFDVLRRALSRLVILYRKRGAPGDDRTVLILALRLARMSGSSLKASHEAYRLAVADWKWGQVLKEIADRPPYPQAVISAWLETATDSQWLAALNWLRQNCSTWWRWQPKIKRIVVHYMTHEITRLSQVAVDLTQHSDWAGEAECWEQVIALAELLEEEGTQTEVLRQSLTRLLVLYKSDGPLASAEKAARVGLRLVHFPDIAPDIVCMAYEEIVREWSWKQIESELSSPDCNHPDIVLLAWSKVPREKDRVLDWMVHHADQVAEWSDDLLETLEGQIEANLEYSLKMLLALGTALAVHSNGRTLAAWYLFRALCSDAQLSKGQLEIIVERVTALDPSRCRALLIRCTGMAETLERLWKAYGTEGGVPREWLRYLPAGAIPKISEMMFAGLLKTWIAQDITLGSKAMSSVVHRLNDATSGVREEFLPQLAASPKQANTFLEALVACEQPHPDVIKPLFANLLDPQLPKSTAIKVLDGLSRHEELCRGACQAAVCLDVWHTLLKDRHTWPLLHESRVESRILTSLAIKWFAYKNVPHRLDMLVVILQDVCNHTNPNWLTPLSLKFQALCLAGRFAEAQELYAQRGDDFRIRGGASDYLSQAMRSRPERLVQYEDEFRALWALMA